MERQVAWNENRGKCAFACGNMTYMTFVKVRNISLIQKIIKIKINKKI